MGATNSVQEILGGFPVHTFRNDLLRWWRQAIFWMGKGEHRISEQIGHQHKSKLHSLAKV